MIAIQPARATHRPLPTCVLPPADPGPRHIEAVMPIGPQRDGTSLEFGRPDGALPRLLMVAERRWRLDRPSPEDGAISFRTLGPSRAHLTDRVLSALRLVPARCSFGSFQPRTVPARGCPASPGRSPWARSDMDFSPPRIRRRPSANCRQSGPPPARPRQSPRRDSGRNREGPVRIDPARPEPARCQRDRDRQLGCTASSQSPVDRHPQRRSPRQGISSTTGIRPRWIPVRFSRLHPGHTRRVEIPRRAGATGGGPARLTSPHATAISRAGSSPAHQKMRDRRSARRRPRYWRDTPSRRHQPGSAQASYESTCSTAGWPSGRGCEDPCRLQP